MAGKTISQIGVEGASVDPSADWLELETAGGVAQKIHPDVLSPWKENEPSAEWQADAAWEAADTNPAFLLNVTGAAGAGASAAPLALDVDAVRVLEITQDGDVVPNSLLCYDVDDGAGNYERAFIRWAASVVQIGAEAAGTGTVRDVAFFRGAAPAKLSLTTNGVEVGAALQPSTLSDGVIPMGTATEGFMELHLSDTTRRVLLVPGSTADSLRVRDDADAVDVPVICGGLEVTTGNVGLFGATPVAQPTTGIAEAAFVENAGGAAVNVDSTFGGYTLQQIAQALQDLGVLA